MLFRSRQRGLLDPDAKPGESPFDHHIWVIASDGDLMEGVSGEASSLAGHQELGNLTVVYDANQISIEDDTDIALTEDVAERYRAYGWHVQSVDGGESVIGIEAAVEAAALEFLKKYSLAGHSPMCGNSIGQDRRFMARYMPTLEAFFHYRNLDVSTLKELCKRWQPEIYKGFKKKSKHTALADIYESIDELKYYREHFLKG